MNLNNESGRVGTYHGIQVFVIEEKKFQPKKSNKNYIYALGQQGTYQKLKLIIWDKDLLDWVNFGTIDADGNNLIEKERKRKEDLDIDLDEMSAGIDRFLNEMMEKSWEV